MLAFVAGMLVIIIFAFARLGLPDMTPLFENPWPLLIFMLLLLGLFVIGILCQAGLREAGRFAYAEAAFTYSPMMALGPPAPALNPRVAPCCLVERQAGIREGAGGLEWGASPIAKACCGYTGIRAIGLLRATLRFGLLATLRGRAALPYASLALEGRCRSHSSGFRPFQESGCRLW